MRKMLHTIRSFWRQEKGAALVELGMVIPLFLLLIFGILEYGRLYWSTTMAQKAMQKASRLATVGPPQCGALPSTHTLSGTAPGGTRFGVLCRSGDFCASPNLPEPCSLDTSTNYGGRIWDEIAALMPSGSGPENVRFTYSHDPRLGFLGGPYTPVVTAELVGTDPSIDLNGDSVPDFEFQFVLPLGPLAALAASDPAIASRKATAISIPAMSTSAPAEDLGVGVPE